ncbi:flagellar biosynthesis chaperone [Symmachiella dynata]|uniref:flagellar export protein FliJ n=1 Tax=Symmachiella dynata TaxID=2527995 RepID=UPI001188050C|nr:flagellar export protein FliJ [Symmachiella dynata]QDT46074.1 flagellar biosynthesis chaperone [Symmachiella dynata]
MPKFQFKLETLLNMRLGRRDQCRQALATILSHDAELAAQMQRVVQQRLGQLQELRDLNSSRSMNIDATAARRYYAGQLTSEIAGIEHQQSLVAEQLEICRQTLVKADQDVKALENLKEKQQAEFMQLQEQRAQRELEDSWSATNRDEVPLC